MWLFLKKKMTDSAYLVLDWLLAGVSLTKKTQQHVRKTPRKPFNCRSVFVYWYATDIKTQYTDQFKANKLADILEQS